MSLAPQVFVSHATEDLDTASRVCKVLEEEGISCWLANRDVEAGTDYAAAILDAIRNSQLVLLIFSKHANASPYVLREIERAIAYDRPVLSLRIDDAVPNASMEYYLNLWQWLDAHAGVEKQRREIVAAVREQLDRASRQVSADGQLPEGGTGAVAPKAGAGHRRTQTTWAIILSAVVLIAVAAGITAWVATRNSGQAAASTTLIDAAGGQGASSTTLMQSHNTWANLNPTGTLPPARSTPMVLDPSTGRLIMFGGDHSDSDNLNDTWAYDPRTNTWSDLKPAGTVPDARGSPVMVYVPSIDKLIMFGGGNTSGILNDTWTYDPKGNRWTKISPSGRPPDARWGASMAVDPASGKVIMFGGATSLWPKGSPNDTWAYDPAANSWTNLHPSEPLPPARYGAAMALSPSTGRLIVFGGVGGGGTLNDVWAYDTAANIWTKLEPSGDLPHARYGPSMVYAPSLTKMIMFGGYASPTTPAIFNDTWTYDPVANTWATLSPTGTLPSPRLSMGAAYDPSTARVIMFGGDERFGGRLNDTWTYTP